MASLQEPCLVKIYAVDPRGNRHNLHQGRVEYFGPGGSADGAIATAVTPNLQVQLPINPLILKGGWKIAISVILDAADGLDVSDGIIQLPVRIRGKGLSQLNATDLGITTDFPAATIAGVEIELGAGKTIPDGEEWRVGGGTCFISVEDDTA